MWNNGTTQYEYTSILVIPTTFSWLWITNWTLFRTNGMVFYTVNNSELILIKQRHYLHIFHSWRGWQNGHGQGIVRFFAVDTLHATTWGFRSNWGTPAIMIPGWRPWRPGRVIFVYDTPLNYFLYQIISYIVPGITINIGIATPKAMEKSDEKWIFPLK